MSRYRIYVCRKADCSEGRFFDDNARATIIAAAHIEEAKLKALNNNPDCDHVLWHETVH